ncbi:MLP-like protein [Arachis hypogaea]|uniref:MLP-like protein n=1 Tax=Arachis hypogaea TaxID=3818 RepID=A0A6B9V899_ARAHY|nr:MLP-like protein [Arachis hypogaea]
MTTSQVQKIETEFPIKADAKEFYDVFCNKTHQVAKVWPDIVQSVVIHEGGWGTERSIISWNYVYGTDSDLMSLVLLFLDVDVDANVVVFAICM